MKRTMIVSSLLVFVVCGFGCTSTFKAVEADPGFTFLRGQLRGTLEAPLPEVETAVKAAMEDLDFVGIDVVSDKLKGEIKARMADGTKVKVAIEALDFESTEVKIKVGTWGDQSISVQILRHIRKKL